MFKLVARNIILYDQINRARLKNTLKLLHKNWCTTLKLFLFSMKK